MTSRPAPRSQLHGGARDQLMTVEQAGEYLGTGERFVRRLITERRITYVKVGKYVRLERSTLEALVDTGRVHSQR
jgi:excisionase family DNA binding protein